MIAITTEGETVEIRPLQKVCGMRFTTVILTYEDVSGDEQKVMDWFQHSIRTRLVKR